MWLVGGVDGWVGGRSAHAHTHTCTIKHTHSLTLYLAQTRPQDKKYYNTIARYIKDSSKLVAFNPGRDVGGNCPWLAEIGVGASPSPPSGPQTNGRLLCCSLTLPRGAPPRGPLRGDTAGVDSPLCPSSAAPADFVNNFEDEYAAWVNSPDGDCPCRGLGSIRCIASIHK